MTSRTLHLVSVLLLLLVACLPFTQAQSSIPPNSPLRNYSVYGGLTEAEHTETTTFLNIARSQDPALQYVWKDPNRDICERPTVYCNPNGVIFSVSEFAATLAGHTLNPPDLNDPVYKNIVWDNVNINELDFKDIVVTCPVDRGFYKATRLVTMDFRNTGINGQLPANLNSLTALKFLYLGGTKITGTLPSYNWPNLQALDLSNTALTGTIPDTFVLNDAATVNFTGTRLSGCMPKTWSDFTRASGANGKVLDCGGTTTTSTTTTSTTTTTTSTTTSTTTTTTTTQKPTTTTTTTTKEPTTTTTTTEKPTTTSTTSTSTTTTTTTARPSLSTSNSTKAFLNLLLNAVPALGVNISEDEDYCSWNTEVITCNESGGYVIFSLADAPVGGSLPDIPSTVDTSSVFVQSISMTGVDLVGTLPPSWSGLASLEMLDLSDNLLSGCIPDGWASMASLAAVNLSDNRFTGNLPQWSLPKLTTADLSHNRLAGTIPSSWGSMPSLTSLTVAGNGLCGCLPSNWPSKLSSATAGMAVASPTCATSNACARNSASCVVDTKPATTTAPPHSHGSAAAYVSCAFASAIVGAVILAFASV